MALPVSIPTWYKGVRFRSRLEARWAAFADLAGWKWLYEPVDLAGWIPDFEFDLPCGHSECSTIAVEQCPHCGSPDRELVTELCTAPAFWKESGATYTYDHVLEARCRACQKRYPHFKRLDSVFHELYAEVKPFRSLAEFEGHPVAKRESFLIPAGAKFGYHPSITEWEMAHGGGGGVYSVEDWVCDSEALWRRAGNMVQWMSPAIVN